MKTIKEKELLQAKVELLKKQKKRLFDKARSEIKTREQKNNHEDIE